MVTTYAGKCEAGSPSASEGWVDGVGTNVKFWTTYGIGRGSDASLYVTECYLAADFPHNHVRRVSPTGLVTTLAGRCALF